MKKDKPTTEQVDGSEKVGRLAVEHALKCEYLADCELDMAFNSVCSRRILDAKTRYLQEFGDADRDYLRPLKRTVPSMRKAIEDSDDLPKQRGDDRHALITERTALALMDVVQCLHGEKSGAKRLNFTDTIDLFDYAAHYFSMHTGQLYLQRQSKTKVWKRGE